MLDRKKYEDYWYAFQEKLDEILEERKMSYRKLSVEIGKSPGYIYDVVNRRIDPSLLFAPKNGIIKVHIATVPFANRKEFYYGKRICQKER